MLSYFVQSLRLISLPFSSPHRKRYHTQIQCARSLPILGFNSSWVHFYKIAPMLGEICEQSRRHCTYHQQGRRRSTAWSISIFKKCDKYLEHFFVRYCVWSLYVNSDLSFCYVMSFSIIFDFMIWIFFLCWACVSNLGFYCIVH